MFHDWTPEQLALRERFAALGEQIAAAREQQPEGFDYAGWNRLRDEQIWHLVIPRDYGGHGEDWWGFTAALDGLSSTIRTPELLLSVIAQAGMVRAMVRHGSPLQKDRYLSAILRGKVSATGIAEPTTGTDVRSIDTTLSGTPDGYRLNGSKFNIAHAPIMDFILVVSRLENRESSNIALVLLDRDTPGLVIGAQDDKLGNRNLPTGQLRFENVRVEASQILGQAGRGLGHLIDIISLGRLYYGLVAANLPLPFVDDAMQYAAKRTSFRSTIDSHQYIQKRLVDMKIGMERSRWAAFGAMARLMNGHPEALLACSVAKLVGASDLIDNATSLVKLYGSIGYHNNGITTLLKDAMGFASVGGTEEMHRKNIFNQMQRLAGGASAQA
ncbi:acyl-CoA dehydrogenase family protein [Paraburkholderia sp. D15]|uniref:acyl-CoA dehydrogenase family protein n=1 Tax=Paraburkholderia sp. D15 TaxID=2880218 RepID=UPI002478F1A3|nr:acyl-CoA dehydrogenase family protein [Paraburkholderia sp. D15]WGS51599.1 acyl-CoA dehydrogenase family protein [Paraburkholderia sp. D15]